MEDESTTSEQQQMTQQVGQEQIHSLLFGDKVSWQAIIYDLVNTEQLDPWAIDLTLLAHKFLERVQALEEANFFVSSKVLFAASLLLRMKSDILLSSDLQSLDDILFGKKEEKKYKQERIELEDDIPDLLARTPLPRYKKVSLEELMQALGHAIKTENRRIQRVIVARQQEYETALSLPKQRINVSDSINAVQAHINTHFATSDKRLAFSQIAGSEKHTKVATFIPLLHLDNQHKVWLEQEGHFQEIWIMLKKLYEEQNREELTKIQKEVEQALKEEGLPAEHEQPEQAEVLSAREKQIIVNDFKQPIGDLFR